MANAIEFSIKGIDQFSKTFKDVGKSLSNVGDNVKRFEDRALGVGKTLTTGVTLPIAGIGAAVLKIAGDFEKSMNRVQAVSGATEVEIGLLREQAKQLGSTTRFSASQAADAMGFLAQAGFSAAETLEAVPGVLQLAASANMDLGQTADIASNILTGFGKSASDLAEVNDVLVAGFTSSNTNLSQLGEAMQEVGPIANSAGQNFELTVAAIGKLSDAGIQGSKAGTSLRNALSRLLDPTKQVQQTLNDLGINAVDSTGKLLPLDEIIRQLEPHADNTAAIIRIFGQEAGPGMAALVSQGSESLTELADKLRNSTGKAAEIATQQSQGLNGAMTSMKSALEGLAIAIADSGFLEFATKMVEKVTGVIRVVSGLPAPVIEAGTVIAATLGVGGPVLIAISVMSKAIRGLIAATGPIGLMITAATLLIEAWFLWGDEIKVIVKEASDFIADTFNELKDKVVATFEIIRDAPSRAMDALKNKAESTFSSMGEKIGGLTSKMTDFVTSRWRDTEDEVVGNSIIPDMADAAIDVFRDWERNTVFLTRRMAEGVEFEMNGMSLRTVEQAFNMQSNLYDVINTGNVRIVEDTNKAFRNMERGLEGVFFGVLKGSMSFSDGMKKIFEDMVDQLLKEIARLASNRIFGSLLNAVFPGLGGLGGGFLGGILGSIGSIFGGIFHGGIEHVPREGTYLLQRGERVLSASQNTELMDMMRSGSPGASGGGSMSIGNASFHFFENARDADAMLRMSREQWREVIARKIIPAMNDLDRSGVRPVSIERAGR